MSILIKGMEMPKNEELIIICSDGTVEMTNNDGSRVCEQKAIELPPHGRLIDADALTTVTEMVDGKWKTYIEEFEIDAAPTIIEAEEVYNKYTDTAGNLHWTGTRSGEHIIRAEDTRTPTEVMLDIADDVMMGESEEEEE